MAFFTMRTTLIIFGLTLLLASCGSPNDRGSDFESDLVIQEDSLILILKDLHLMDAAAKQNVIPNNSNTHLKYQEYKAILEKYKVSRTRFDSTIHVYSLHGKIVEEESAQSPK
jgi:hypothetical protein